ncbi:NUDIX domain-containing protein [Acinetobacter sp. S40]|uniref:NUDIX domain-containing protein n=1 Tax=Acinetobacter sp. S40 TaxID=2767434 RepID=UPI0019095A86|nr:NUDIX domain-containing protein [Acinetobacter sp. S40]MBJ9984827.1 NUDIX domain-containing protein [Acinetobacter sp. S40]
MSKPVIDIAIGLLLHHGKVLVGWREAKQHQGNKYEFPGGKVESGESPEDACRREIYEEVGIGIKQWYAFDRIQHEYEDIIVYLHLFYAYVPDDLLTLIQQPWTWYHRDQLMQLNFPKANDTILQRLFWSHFIKIGDKLSEFQPHADSLFYWRVDAEQFQRDVLHTYSADDLTKLILNDEHYQQLSDDLKPLIKTLHLKQHQLMQFKKGDLELGKRYIAACHDLVALQHAEQIGCEAVFVSPIQPTQTHPHTKALGWTQLEEWSKQSQVLVFALGGLHPNDLAQAQLHGAYGIAGIRNF